MWRQKPHSWGPLGLSQWRINAGLTEKDQERSGPRNNQSLFLLRWEQGMLGEVGSKSWEGVCLEGRLPGGGPERVGEAPSTAARVRSLGSRIAVCHLACIPSCRDCRSHLSQLFVLSANPSSLCSPHTVAMKSMLLPILALWVGCCPAEALAKKGLSLRESMTPPTPMGLPALQPPLPSRPRPPDGE